MYRRILSIAFAASLSLMALPATIADASTTAIPALNHVYLIVGENTSLSQITRTHAPFQTSWVKPNSAWLTDYWGISHYSTSNYIAMTSGQFLHCHQLDEKPATCNQDIDNLFNQLTNAGVSWLEWNESMPQPCYLINAGTDQAGNPYRVKHNPAAYYADIEGGDFSGTTGSTFCGDHVISMGGTGFDDTSGFDGALASGNVPRFNYIVPNQCEDGHDNCKPEGDPIRQFDDFLAREIPNIMDSPSWGSGDVILVVYDEGQGGSPNGTKNYAGGNTPFAAIGDPVVPGQYGSFANHYSLLRTLEDAFGISTHLGAAASAGTLGNIWGP